MTMPAVMRTRPVTAGLGIVAIGIVVALATMLGLAVLRPTLLAFAAGGLVVLVPPLMMREPRAYWLFLFAVSIPFDVSKRITAWLAVPWDLYRQYHMPGSGTLSIDIYLTDVVLFAMILPWLVRLCLRREALYFPRIAYTFVLYLAYALIVALLEATSVYLAVFEWCRQLLYFLSFVYLINNISTRAQLRAIVIALFVGAVVGAGSVVAMSAAGTGTGTDPFFSALYTKQGVESKATSQETLYVQGLSAGEGTKRSSGMFTHPAHAAYYLEFILPIILGYLVATRRTRDQALLAAALGLGFLAIFLTFSRSGLVGLFCGIVVFFAVGRWSRLISKKVFAVCVVIFVTTITIAGPALIYSLWARPQTIAKRMELNEAALDTYLQRPLLGAGLNNSSAVSLDPRFFVRTSPTAELTVAIVHNHYLIMLMEVGLVGFLLYFGFFWQTIQIALRHMRAAEMELKLLLVGIVASLTAISVHNLGDPFGGHVVQAMLWLHFGLIVAICRWVRAESALPAARKSPAPAKPLSRAAEEYV